MPPNNVALNVLRRLTPRAVARVEPLTLSPASLLQSSSRISSPYQPPQTQLCLKRTFTISPSLLKKKGRAEREAEESSSSKTSAAEIEDPFDFSALNNALEKNLEKLKNDLSKLRTGGRFNPEALEDLRVSLSKESKKAERLGDLAQVLPKGRNVQILVGEKDHVKQITSTIQTSTLNLTPVPDPQNPLILTMPIPPPTKESRDAALAAAGKAGETAAMGVKNARAVCHKRLRGMELKKAARPDDLRKAGKDMEKIVEKASGDLKKTVDSAKKAMEQQ